MSLREGERFIKGEAVRRAGAVSPPAAVFLIHGWGVRAAAMGRLAAALAEAGYAVFNYDYPTSRRSIADHAAIFLDRYRRLLAEENPAGPIRFVTHSMGGIVLRAALAAMTEAECRAIDAIVMLGPPNGGSALARPGRNRFVRAFNASLGDMVRGPESYLRRIPPPPWLPPVGIVAARFDGKVALRSTPLPNGMPCCLTMVSGTHPGLRDPRRTLAPILHFFRHHDFGSAAQPFPRLVN